MSSHLLKSSNVVIQKGAQIQATQTLAKSRESQCIQHIIWWLRTHQ